MTLRDRLISDRTILLLLQVGAFLCLTGWTWVHFYWSSPIGTLLWGNSSWTLAQKLGMDWQSFVGTGANDGFVHKVLFVIKWLLLTATAATLVATKKHWPQKALILMGSLLLTIVSYALYVKSQHQLPMFVEHGGQMLMPALFISALHFGVRHKLTLTIALAACITTFIGHGCYALGLWPTPGKFYGMTTIILGTSEAATTTFLRVAGVLDFAICIGLFYDKFRVPSALYAAAWGLATALARPISGMSTELTFWGADQWIHEAVLRSPHFIIPIYLYMLWHKPKESKPQAKATPAVAAEAKA